MTPNEQRAAFHMAIMSGIDGLRPVGAAALATHPDGTYIDGAVQIAWCGYRRAAETVDMVLARWDPRRKITADMRAALRNTLSDTMLGSADAERLDKLIRDVLAICGGTAP